MSICVVDGRHCRCQPEIGVPCDGVESLKEQLLQCNIDQFATEARVDEIEKEMQVMSDKLTCALLEARENMEIANEFKLTMEEYRQREAMAYLALREAAALLSTTPKFSCETPEFIMEYLLNAPREKNVG